MKIITFKRELTKLLISKIYLIKRQTILSIFDKPIKASKKRVPKETRLFRTYFFFEAFLSAFFPATISCKALPGLNFGTIFAGIVITAPVLGLLPFLA